MTVAVCVSISIPVTVPVPVTVTVTGLGPRFGISVPGDGLLTSEREQQHDRSDPSHGSTHGRTLSTAALASQDPSPPPCDIVHRCEQCDGLLLDQDTLEGIQAAVIRI